MSRYLMCIVCGAESRPLFRKHGHWIWECDACGHQFCSLQNCESHVEHIYGDDYFNGDPAGYPDYLSEREMLISHGRRYARVLRRYTKPGTVLDVGAAAGFILKGFEDDGWTCRGIEPNLHMAEYARSRLGLEVRSNALEQVQPGESYDLVMMIQVVMHFINPRTALRKAAEITKPGGYWLIEAWNRESWMARVFRDSWHVYSPPSVLHWFSANGLRRLVEDCGFREIASGRPKKEIGVGHAAALARYKYSGSGIGRLMVRLIAAFPRGLSLPYLGDDIFWGLYRNDGFLGQTSAHGEAVGLSV